jgi:hypothetical protein
VRKILFLICLLAIPCASLTQTKTSWANLTVLRAGQKIQVVDIHSKKHSGTFANVSDTAISYMGTAGQQTVQKQDVHSVKLMENKHRLRNTLILGAVGAGVGAGIGVAVSSCSSSFCIGPSRGKSVGIGVAGVGAVGAIVGALLPSHDTIYSASSH